MTEERRCTTCGTPLEDEGCLTGICTACIFRECLEEKSNYSSAHDSRQWTPPSVAELQSGFTEYEIKELIGRGGMGAVYKAIQKNLNRPVAIKILPPILGWTPAYKDRFSREAFMLAKLNHPGIVTIHDFGQNNDLYYLVMEHVEGKTLSQHMFDSTFSPRETLELISRLGEIMEFAHSIGVVHRDLKPDNILITNLNQLKVADFGLAKLFDAQHEDDPAAFAASCGAAGTRAFMAPEQMTQASQADHRADIYSLGVMLYLLLTGMLPDAANLIPPSKAFPGLGDHFDGLAMKALQTNPAERHQSMAELRQNLQAVIRQEIEQETVAAASEHLGMTRRRHWLFAGLGSLAAACLFGIGLWLMMPTIKPPVLGTPYDVNLGNTIRLALQSIPAGKFEMGSPLQEKPDRHKSESPRQITISKPFWMGKYEVTQAQYQAIMGINPSYRKDPNSPVEWVSWNNTSLFFDLLNARERSAGRLPAGYAYRLPTEAEWEYAARAAEKSIVLTDIAKMAATTWNRQNSDNQTHPVGQKQPNGWGLYDMFGNVGEWCCDCWDRAPEAISERIDPVVLPGKYALGKVLRGGDFTSEFFRSAQRKELMPDVRLNKLGFRVALAPILNNAAQAGQPNLTSRFSPLSVKPPEFGKSYYLRLQETPLDMLAVKAGEFIMGSPLEEPRHADSEYLHQVRISQPFWMGRTEVTQAQYDAIMNSNPSSFLDAGKDAPVETVSWHAAMLFCQKLTASERLQERLPENYAYRLPTEAEWEYACRAGGKTAAVVDNNSEALEALCWNFFNSKNQPQPVGQKQANAWGFQDMFGNVSEWCLDYYKGNAYVLYGEWDPLCNQPDFVGGRVVRGGGFSEELFRCASRAALKSRYHQEQTGFRIVLAPDRGIKASDNHETAASMRSLAALPTDAQGCRQIPMPAEKRLEWWRGSRALSKEPEGMRNSGNGLAGKIELYMQKIIDASQSMEFCLKWKFGLSAPDQEIGLAPKAPVEFSIGLDALSQRNDRLGQIVAGPTATGVSVNPDTWYYLHIQVITKNENTLIMTLATDNYGKDGGKIIKEWEYPLDDTTMINLSYATLQMVMQGDPLVLKNRWILCAEAKILLPPAAPVQKAELPDKAENASSGNLRTAKPESAH
jgi:formylglycine-generating enzyme required for sulfatase activity